MMCAFPFDRYPVITIAHGGGGKLSQTLIDEIFCPIFESDSRSDGAQLFVKNKISLSTDSFVVHPLFFPGGDIGSMAVKGTCNDLAMCGATPRYLTCSFILEEGLPTKTLFNIAQSMQAAAKEINVKIVTGDTKVVEKNHGDGIYINTTGIGENFEHWDVGPRQIKPGDLIAINGDLGRHGATIMAQRDQLQLSSQIESDCAHLYPQVKALYDQGVSVHCLRDLTRGGLATSLCELSEATNLEFEINALNIPISPNVQNLCELLGLDPLYAANEGRMVVILPQDEAQKTDLVIIGQVTKTQSKNLILNTGLGSKRILRKLSGEQLPRIC